MSRHEARPGLVLYGLPHPNDGADREGGPPHKYNREVHEKIVELIRRGATPDHAAAACGIKRATYYDWIRKGTSGDPWLAEFAEDVDQALHQSHLANEGRLFDVLNSQTGSCPECGRLTPKERIALAELQLKVLERRDADNWSKQVKHIAQNSMDQFLAVCEQQLSPKEYEKVLLIASQTVKGVLGGGEDDDD